MKDIGFPVRRTLGPALAIFVIASATIAGAWIFQAFGYAPCELCLKERWPYYVGIGVSALAIALSLRGPRGLLPAAFAMLFLIFAASAALGAYHAGVEWRFWPGPEDCTGSFQKAATMQDFLKQLHTVKVVRCDAVAIRILGLSLAGWNAVISVALAGLAVVGLRPRESVF
ncbi:MAG: disulfide bond formation protein B [Methylovirgula sp.]